MGTTGVPDTFSHLELPKTCSHSISLFGICSLGGTSYRVLVALKNSSMTALHRHKKS
jgi:hypothetical protein